MNPTLKSILAVVAGFVTVVVLSVLTDAVFEGMGVFPGQNAASYAAWMLLLALLYRTAFTVLGGYVTARIAPANPVKHAVILGCVGMVAGILGALANWDKGAHWYPILLVVLAIPSTWFGGLLRTRQ